MSCERFEELHEEMKQCKAPSEDLRSVKLMYYRGDSRSAGTYSRDVDSMRLASMTEHLLNGLVNKYIVSGKRSSNSCALASTQLSRERIERIASWNLSVVDWNAFLRLAEHHESCLSLPGT